MEHLKGQLPIASAGTHSTASIQGTVTDRTTGRPIASVHVTAVRAGLPPASQTVQSALDGTFQLQKLPPGEYRLCAQVAGETYLDPCHWSPPQAASGSTVTLKPGQAAGGIRIDLRPAALMQVRINDPQKLLSQPGKNVLVGVFTGSGLFRPALAKATDAGGQNHEVSVPFDTPVRLSVSSAQVAMSDDKGKPLTAVSPAVPVTHPSVGPAPSPITFTVTGPANK